MAGKHPLHAVHFAKHFKCIIIVLNPILQRKQAKQREILRHVKDWKQLCVKPKDSRTQKRRCWAEKTGCKH